ncbi:MAG: hypothetical protein O3B84_06545 [Chloroflexi bacterium]|nr:hypothetical protein [Chloroflexota bacterium]
MIDNMVGVIRFMARLDAMVAFNRDTLRLPVHADHRDFVAFEPRQGIRLHIGRHSQVWTEKDVDPYRVMLNVATMEIHSEYERLWGPGVEFIRPPEREG